MAKNENTQNDIDQALDVFDIDLLEVLSDIQNPYPTKVDFTKNQYSLFEIKRTIENEEIRLTPDFQRNEDIWKNKKKSRLIESILMGIPLPLFYFAENKDGGLSVVDGLQRLSAIVGYMDNKFKLSELTYLKEFKDKNFKTLSREEQIRIERYQIQVNVISADTPEAIKLDIFERINSGGDPLNKQEMRHALYQGKSTELLKELANSQEFKQAVSSRLNVKRMRDRYVILRALSFYLWRNKKLTQSIASRIKTEISGDFDDFLGRYMRIINAMTYEYINDIKNTFKKSMILFYDIYKNNAFKRDISAKSPFNMIIFESLFFVTAYLRQYDIRADILRRELDKIMQEDWFTNILDNSLKGAKRITEHFDNLQKEINRIRDKYA